MTDVQSPRLAFIIPVKNDARRLERCLSTINAAAGAVRVEIVVADNGSTDDSPDVARKAGARVLTLPDVRVSTLRNQAAALTSAPAIAFVDADHGVVTTWARDALDALSPACVGAAGALYHPPGDGTWVQRLYGALRGNTVGRSEVRWLASGNLVVRREAFEAVRGFDTTLVACEDVDFCRRLHAAGWHVMADDRLESVHYGDPATLGALFRAERWRGLNNLRVTLRPPVDVRDLPSALIPVIELVAVVVLVASMALVRWRPEAALVALACVSCVLVLVGLRASRIVSRLPVGRSGDLLLASLVAATYDAARALALVGRAPHHRKTDDGRPATNRSVA